MNQTERRMMLMLVRHTDEVELARVLCDGLGDEFPAFLLFMTEELRDRFGDSPFMSTTDHVACLVNPERFCAMVCFAAPREASGNLLYLNCFREIGLATVEVQRTFLQEGFPNSVACTDDGQPSCRTPSLNGVPSSFAAEHLLAWSGPDGVGYPRAKPELSSVHFQQRELIAVTSNFDWHVYGEKQRYQFAISIMRLARSHPELHFVWRPRDAELQHGEGKQILAMVEDYRLKNLVVEKIERVDAILARCRAGIAMVGTTLLDYEMWQKPVAVYSCEATDEVAPGLRARGFRNYFDLARLLPSLCAEPSGFMVHTGVDRLDAQRLRERLRAMTQHSTLRDDCMVTTLKYIAYVREGRAVRNDVMKLSGVVSGFERQMRALDKRVGQLPPGIEAVQKDIRGLSAELAETREWLPSIADSVGSVGERVGKVADRVGVLQRSTLAYKTRKFVSKFGG